MALAIGSWAEIAETTKKDSKKSVLMMEGLCEGGGKFVVSSWPFSAIPDAFSTSRSKFFVITAKKSRFFDSGNVQKHQLADNKE